MKHIKRVGILILAATLPIGVRAGQQATCTHTEKTWQGDLSAVNTQDNTVKAKHWVVTETFHLGEHCAIVDVEKKKVPLCNLSPGEKVRICYQEVEGVRIADRVVERALHYSGTVDSVDPKIGMVTMEETPLYKPFHVPATFRTAKNCKLTLATGSAGKLADVRPGDRIAVIYELPGGSPVAYQITEQSLNFVGTLDSINLPARTIKAKKMDGEETFQMAEQCRFEASNQHNEPLKDLAVGQQYRFTYQAVNGVNVLDRISPAQEQKPTETASIKYMHGF